MTNVNHFIHCTISINSTKFTSQRSLKYSKNNRSLDIQYWKCQRKQCFNIFPIEFSGINCLLIQTGLEFPYKYIVILHTNIYLFDIKRNRHRTPTSCQKVCFILIYWITLKISWSLFTFCKVSRTSKDTILPCINFVSKKWDKNY